MKPPRPKATITILPTVALRRQIETLWQSHGEEMREILKDSTPPGEIEAALRIHKGEFFIAVADALEWVWQRYEIACEAGTAKAKERFADEVQAASDECLAYLSLEEPNEPDEPASA